MVAERAVIVKMDPDLPCGHRSVWGRRTVPSGQSTVEVVLLGDFDPLEQGLVMVFDQGGHRVRGGRRVIARGNRSV